MSLATIFNFLGSIVVLAGITVLVTSPETRGVVNSLAAGIIGLLRTAMGR